MLRKFIRNLVKDVMLESGYFVSEPEVPYLKLLRAKGYDVKSPVYDGQENAGVDMYAPAYNEVFEKAFYAANPHSEILTRTDLHGKKQYFIRLAPFSAVLVPSGFYTKFPPSIAYIGFNKSGRAVKARLSLGACVDDSSYQDILFIHVYNTSSDFTEVVLDEKLAQFVRVKIDNSPIQVFDENEVPYDEFFKVASKRGKGSQGSTGVN